jgi:hypothetical protein
LPDAATTRGIRRISSTPRTWPYSQGVPLVPFYRGVNTTRPVGTGGRDEAERKIRAGLTTFPASTFILEQYVANPPHMSVF